MSSVLRIGVLVGILCLSVALSVPAIADEIQHEHPDEVDGDADLESLERWLSDGMGEIHVDCADGIGIGSFDPCEDLDGEYSELIGRYATVENDLESETETAETFNETRTKQREYADLREEFETTYEEYEAAREAGNEAEARTRARELLDMADRIEELGGDIEVNLVGLDESTAADLSSAARTINSSTEEVRAIALEIETESFEAAEIDATADATATFADPGRVSGRVSTADGTGLADADVVVSDGTQSFTTTTAADGTYELSYRPTRTPVGTTNLTIRYRPVPDDPYLGAETAETTEVHATDSAVRIEDGPSEVAFGDRLLVTGDVRAGDASVPDIDVGVYAGSERLATTRTDADGSFRAVTRIPATLASGADTLEVRASEPARAIRPSRASRELAVLETATELNASATAADGEIEVSGRLRADAEVEAPVGPRPITVQIGEETHEVRTDPDGRYRLTTERNSSPETVTATYNETGVNLGPSRAEATVEYAGAGTAATTAARFLPTDGIDALSLALVGIALALALAVAFAFSRVLTRDSDADDGSSPAEPTSETDGDAADIGSAGTSVEGLLDVARRQLRTDPQEAVYASYAAVRTLLGASADQTHWELYNRERRSSSAEDDRTDDAFYTLTELFERAAFAAGEVDATQAEAALRAAERYLGLEATDSAGSTD